MRQETQGPMDYGDTILTQVAGKPLVSRPLTEPLKKQQHKRKWLTMLLQIRLKKQKKKLLNC